MNVGNIFKNLTWLDALIIAAIFLLSLFLQIAFLHSDGKTPRIARVNAAGSEYIFSLKTDGVFCVKGAVGESILEVRGGKIRIADSPCPNKTCVQQGFVSSGALICLPNKIAVSVEGANENKIDAVAR